MPTTDSTKYPQDAIPDVSRRASNSLRQRRQAKIAEALGTQSPKTYDEAQVTITVTLPRSLVEQVESAGNEAYRSGDPETKAKRFTALAEAYLALSERSPDLWLIRLLLNAQAYALDRAESWNRTMTSVPLLQAGES
jgi:hypothetical protein